MSFSSEFEKKLDELYKEFLAFDATQSDRLSRYRNIEPESAKFIAMLIRIQQSKKILEIGTSTGYSTLWLADAVQVTSGKIITLEIDAERSKVAFQHAKNLNVERVVDFRVGDAKEFLSSSKELYDFILLDAERDAYVEYWNYLPQLMAEKGVLIVDNVVSHSDQIKDFVHLVNLDERFMTTILPIGAGLFMVTFKDH